jgi:hypothetical protein
LTHAGYVAFSKVLAIFSFFSVQGDVVVHPFSTQDLLAEYLMDNPDTEGQDPVKDMENLHPRYFLRSMRNAFPAGIPQPTTAKAPGPSKLTPAEMKY